MPTQPSDATSVGRVLCRICNKGCPMIAEIRDGRLVAVRGSCTPCGAQRMASSRLPAFSLVRDLV